MPGRDAGRYRIAHLHQPAGWLSPGYLEIAADGTIAAVSDEQPAAWDGAEIKHLDGYVVPGMVNLHSHAHQRGLAGHAEGAGATREAGADDFWAWRERMYELVGALDPERFEAIAAQAYLEMLKRGYTAVGEFHYLHHDRDGRPYANPAEMSERVLAAAERTGIALTLLPTLYTHGGIGKPPTPGQRRFVHADPHAYLRLVAHLRARLPANPLLRVGIAPHSLRAVSADNLRLILAGLAEIAPDIPIHMHLAEQQAEIDECLARLGARPGRWLLDNLPVDTRWTLIHATHCRPDELEGIAQAGATVGLCPLTEANLGDGVFNLPAFHQAGGRWGIGSDGNTIIDPAQELRVLEYGQRLTRQHRAILAEPGSELTAQPGRLLYDLALAGGAASLDQPVGRLTPGLRADLIELDPESPPLAGQSPATALDAWIFAAVDGVVRNVMVGGDWVVRDGRHPAEDEIFGRFRAVVEAVWRS